MGHDGSEDVDRRATCRRSARLALAAVALVWLIACTNASNLLIARVTSRTPELGRSRRARRLARTRRPRICWRRARCWPSAPPRSDSRSPGLASVCCATSPASYIPRIAGDRARRRDRLAVARASPLASALLFGLIPALHGTRRRRSTTRFARGADRPPAASSVRRLRRLLVGSQFAITTPLLIIAGLLLASLHQLARVDLGIDTHNSDRGLDHRPQSRSMPRPGRVIAFWDRAADGVWKRCQELRRRVQRWSPAERCRRLQQLRSRGRFRRRRDSRSR